MDGQTAHDEPVDEPEDEPTFAPLTPDRVVMISETDFIWDGIDTCTMVTIPFMRVDGNLVEGTPTESPATAMDCCLAGIGLEATIDPCTI